MDSLNQEWEAYKAENNRKYDAEEDEMRKKIFAETKKRVEEHNKLYEQGKTTFTMGINAFADRLPEEMNCCGVRKPKKDDASTEG